MARITKQERKYNIKTTEEKPVSKPKTEKKVESTSKFRVLIDNANFMLKKYDSYEEADLAGREFCHRSSAVYMVVEGCN